MTRPERDDTELHWICAVASSAEQAAQRGMSQDSGVGAGTAGWHVGWTALQSWFGWNSVRIITKGIGSMEF